MKILVTGVAGFIGFHVVQRLLRLGHIVIGVDNLCDYYDPKLKHDRLSYLRSQPNANNFSFYRMDIADATSLRDLFDNYGFSHILNLAAQAGVRYSLQAPEKYIEANLVGFGNLLECCRYAKVEHLVYASSSSVYGLNEMQPYSVHKHADHPVSLYAASKRSNELMAHAYSHLFHIPATGLRFFTVYGPWGRPDMALDLFAHSIMRGEPIRVFNNGKMQRDFTYIDDIAEGVIRVLGKPAIPAAGFDPVYPDPAISSAPWRIYNIGNNHTVALIDFIHTLELALGKKAILNFAPMQPGDVESTWADISDLSKDFNFEPQVSLQDGIKTFVEWFKDYYGY